MRLFRVLFAGLAVILIAAAAGTTASASDLTFERGLFLLAERALERGDRSAYRNVRSTLEGYPLTPYLDYREATQDLGKADPETLRDFVETHRDLPLSAQLRSRYLAHLAREEAWPEYLEWVGEGRDLSVQQDCDRRRALLETGHVEAAFEGMESVWLHGQSRPEACDPVLDAWRDAGGLTATLARGRFELAMQAGQTSLARYLQRYLARADQDWGARWLELLERPGRVLEVDFRASDHPFAQAMLEQAFRSWIAQDLDAALKGFAARAQLGLPAARIHALEHAMALRLAVRYRDETLAFMETLDAVVFDDQLRQWQVRAALHQRDWDTVRRAVRSMSSEAREETVWQYWYARALEQTGEPDEARRSYERAAQERNFHGFLAADRLGQPYRIGHQPLQRPANEREAIRQHPAMQRMRELVALDRYAQARREWTRAVASMETAELEAAALEFAEWNWYDRAIFTAARARHWDDIELRFPLAFESLIVEGARQQGIDPAWAMAIARQESAFLQDVRSGAGALGIMQIMPATGRSIASSVGLQVNSDQDILDPANNARMGAYYLRRNLDRFGGHSLLSTVAYNAGASRVHSWLPETGAMEGDIWAELIPFAETRDYVRRVYAYQIIYAVRMGQEPPSLSQLLFPVTSQSQLAESREEHLRMLRNARESLVLERSFCDAPGYTDRAC